MSKNRELGELAEIVTVNTAANSVSFGSVTINTVAIVVSGQQINGTSFSGNANTATYANGSFTNTFTVGTAAYFVANGNVGIGTSSPSDLLDVQGGHIRIHNDYTVGSYKIGAFGSYIGRNSADGATYFNYAQAPLYFKAGGTDTVTFASNGNVGIGNTTPQSKLVVQTTNTDLFPVRFINSTTPSTAADADNFTIFENHYGLTQISNWQNLGMRIGSRLIRNGGNGHIYFTVAGDSVHSFMAANGNMGIGNTAPQSKLVVNGSGHFNGITLSNTVGLDVGFNTNYSFITSGNRGANTTNRLDFEGSSFRWLTGFGTDQIAQLDSTGLGIGTSTPLTGLEVSRSGEVGSIVHWPGNSRGGLWALSTQRVALTTTNTADDLVFGYLNPSAANSFVEQARLDTSTGNFKIGASTTLPSEMLEIYKTGGGTSIRWHYPGIVEYKGGIAAGESLFRFGNANGDAAQSGINHFTMTSAGRVGIHTTSQGNYNLFVQTTNGNYAPMRISGGGSQAWGIGLIVETTGGTDGAGIVWRSRGTKNWQIRGQTNGTAFQICEDGGDASGGLDFGTARVHIAPGGAIYFGATSTSGYGDTRFYQESSNFRAMTVNHSGTGWGIDIDTSATYNDAAFISRSARTTGLDTFQHFVGQTNSGGVGRITIRGDGNIYNVNNVYAAISDRKLKENITDATPKLQDLLKVKIRHYNLINDENKSKQIGVISDEIEEVFPGLVETQPDKDEDGKLSGTTTKTVKYSILIPILVKSIQELNDKFESLQTEFDKYKETHP